jgi:hypothetical protein
VNGGIPEDRDKQNRRRTPTAQVLIPHPPAGLEIDYAGRGLFRIEQADLGQFDSRRLDDKLLPRLGLFSNSVNSFNSVLSRQLLLILPLLKPALLGPLLAALGLTLFCHPFRLRILCSRSGVVLGSGGLRPRDWLCRNGGGLRSLLGRRLRRRSFGRSLLGRLRISRFLLRLRLLLLLLRRLLLRLLRLLLLRLLLRLRRFPLRLSLFRLRGSRRWNRRSTCLGSGCLGQIRHWSRWRRGHGDWLWRLIPFQPREFQLGGFGTDHISHKETTANADDNRGDHGSGSSKIGH